MKVVAGLLLFTSIATQGADRWTALPYQTSEFTWSVDKSTIRRASGQSELWARAVRISRCSAGFDSSEECLRSMGTEMTDGYEYRQLYVFWCARKEYVVSAAYRYTRDGRVIPGSGPAPENRIERKLVVPDTIEDVLGTIACAKPAPVRPAKKSIPTT